MLLVGNSLRLSLLAGSRQGPTPQQPQSHGEGGEQQQHPDGARGRSQRIGPTAPGAHQGGAHSEGQEPQQTDLPELEGEVWHGSRRQEGRLVDPPMMGSGSVDPNPPIQIHRSSPPKPTQPATNPHPGLLSSRSTPGPATRAETQAGSAPPLIQAEPAIPQPTAPHPSPPA